MHYRFRSRAKPSEHHPGANHFTLMRCDGAGCEQGQKQGRFGGQAGPDSPAAAAALGAAATAASFQHNGRGDARTQQRRAGGPHDSADGADASTDGGGLHVPAGPADRGHPAGLGHAVRERAQRQRAT